MAPRVYDTRGIPGFETVRFSITCHRGCCGECSFCSVSMHQGRIIQSRSLLQFSAKQNFCHAGPISEAQSLTWVVKQPICFMAHCDGWEKNGACETRSVLCRESVNLRLGYREAINLYCSMLDLPGVSTFS